MQLGKSKAKAFSHTRGILNAAGDLEGAVSPPMGQGQSPGGIRGKAPEML